jgi:hypothetical protein
MFVFSTPGGSCELEASQDQTEEEKKKQLWQWHRTEKVPVSNSMPVVNLYF